MLSLEGVKSILEDRNYKKSEYLERASRVYYEMSLHIDGACPAFYDGRYESMVYPTNYYGVEYQKLFEVFLFSKFPFESDATRNYRLSQYRPYQQEFFLKAIQIIVGAIFQDGNYNINIDNAEDNSYLWGENFEGKHLIQWISHYFTYFCSDPNGKIVLIPKKSRIETDKKVEPDLWFIPSIDIKYSDSEDLIFKKDGYKWHVNKIGYFRYEEVEKGSYRLLDEGGYYAHMLNRLPVYTAGGIWNTKGFYNSWLYAAKAIADEFVGEKSLAQFVNKQNAHPFFIASDDDCPSCQGVGEIQFCKKCAVPSDECNCSVDYDTPYNPNWSKSNCTSCGGSGKKTHDPAKWMYVPKEDMSNDQIKIVSANTDIPRVQFDNIKDVERRIQKALHLNYIEEAQSKIAKDKDMESRYQFLSMITNYIFDNIIYNIIKDFISIRNVTVRDGVITPGESQFSLVKPTQFSIKTSEELLEEMGGDIPDYVKAKQIEDYVGKKFGGDEVLVAKTSYILQIDKLAVCTDEAINNLMINGGIDRRDLLLHVNLPTILDEIIRQQGGVYFIEAGYDKIIEDVYRIFEEKHPSTLSIENTIRNMGMGLEGNATV